MSGRRHVTLIGFKGCGKTTVGRELAKEMEAEFIDLDREIETLYAKESSESLTFRAIYRALGHEGFRALERRAAEQVRARLDNGAPPHVLATGGGAIIDERTREVLRDFCRFIYLRVPIDILLERMRAGGAPAFVKGDDPEQEFIEIYRAREPVYEQMADMTVDATLLIPAEAGRPAIARLAEALRFTG